MSAESTLYTLLTGNPGVTALVGTRIYPDIVPEGKATPYIGYERVATDPVAVMSGPAPAAIARITLACWADTRTAADAVAAAVVAAMVNTDFTHLASGSEVDEATGRLSTTVDCQILTT